MRPRSGTTKKWKPSPTQLRSARAQERAYRSQGRAVQRVANVQRRLGPGIGVGAPTRGPGLAAKERQAAKKRAANRAWDRRVKVQRRRAETKRIRGQVQRSARQTERYYSTFGRIAGPPTPYRPPKKKESGLGKVGDVALSSLGVPGLAIRALQKAGVLRAAQAPAAFALEQTLRPTYAIASAAKKDVQEFKKHGVTGIVGHGSLKAAGRGFTMKEKTTFSDVLAEAGVKNPWVKAIAGFALDVGLDPTTYITLGTASVARQGAARAALRAAKDAGKRGASKAEQKAIFRDVEKRQIAHRERTGKGRERGIEVRVAGKRVPGVTRAGHRLSREVARSGRELARPVTAKRTAQDAGNAVRNVAASVHGGVRKAGVARGERDTVEGLQRETRAARETQTRHGVERANSILGSFSEAERRAILDAIEAEDIGRLRDAGHKAVSLRAARLPSERKARGGSERLYQAALTVRSELAYHHRVARRAGPVSGVVGAKGKTRAESLLSARATAPKAREPSAKATKYMGKQVPKAQAAVTRARTALDKATERVGKAKTPAERAKAKTARDEAREQLVAANRRLVSLRRGLGGAQRQARIARAAKHGERTLRRRRLTEGAKGYYPRIDVKDVQEKSILQRLATVTSKGEVSRHGGESIGAAKPKPNAGKHRELTPSRAQLEAQEKNVTARWSEDPRVDLAHYSRQMAKAASAGNLNLRMLQQLGRKVPKGLTKDSLRALQHSDDPLYVYRVRQGKMERLDADSDWGVIEKVIAQKPLGKRADQRPELLTQRGALPSGGQYALMPKRLEAEIRDAQPILGQDISAFQAFDWAQAGFKGLALATPGYLTRNFGGDLWNASLYEGNKLRLVGNIFKGGRALNALGRYERGLRRFGASIPKEKRTIKLSPEQVESVAQIMRQNNLGKEADELLRTRKANALQVAQLAEQAGAIRQGRFLELMDEGRGLRQLRGSGLWRNLVKRVEDTVRIGTFLGAMQRGALPREAAKTASDYHIDYGALTTIEKSVLRRLMPFYTFTSRNIPIQAKAFATRPGRFATLEKAREEGRKATGLPEGYEEKLDPYEARQLGIPIPLPGGRSATASIGSPFVDLNDIFALGAGNLNAPVKRSLEMLGPWKTPVEMAMNVSFFYRDQIEPNAAPDTRAPEWAVALAKLPGGKSWAKQVGLRSDFIDNTTGEKTWGWAKKTDYGMRQALPGPLGLITRLPGLGTKTETSRGMGPLESFATVLGPRVKEYKPLDVERNKLYARQDELGKRQARLRRTAHPTAKRENGLPARIDDEHSTPEYRRNQREESRIEKRLIEIERKLKSKGYIRGKPAESYSGGGGGGGDGLVLDEDLGPLILD